MANWRHTVDIKDDWTACSEDEITVQEFIKRVIPKLEALPQSVKTFTFEGIVGELKELGENEEATKDEFDAIWEDVHNWADFYKVWLKAI